MDAWNGLDRDKDLWSADADWTVLPPWSEWSGVCFRGRRVGPWTRDLSTGARDTIAIRYYDMCGGISDEVIVSLRKEGDTYSATAKWSSGYVRTVRGEQKEGRLWYLEIGDDHNLEGKNGLWATFQWSRDEIPMPQLLYLEHWRNNELHGISTYLTFFRHVVSLSSWENGIQSGPFVQFSNGAPTAIEWLLEDVVVERWDRPR